MLTPMSFFSAVQKWVISPRPLPYRECNDFNVLLKVDPELLGWCSVLVLSGAQSTKSLSLPAQSGVEWRLPHASRDMG